MAAPPFVHLHLHTEYSLLDGAIRLKDLFPAARRLGYDTVALTDHGNLYGALNFYTQALEHSIKPILGCELYVAPKGRRDRSASGPRDAAYHLVVLAQDVTGYKNLLKLVSAAHLEGFYYKPRVDMDLLRELNPGLIALSACLHGQIPHRLLLEDYAGAKALAETYASIFDGRFYLELQENGIPEQTVVNRGLREISRETGIPLVATNDCHYLTHEDAKAHDVLLCIQTNRTIHDEKRMRFSTDRLYFAPPEEMAARFADCPEAIAATREIAERCHVELELGRHRFPVFPMEKGETYEERFSQEARSGFERRLAEPALKDADQEAYRQRLEEEIAVITEKGFASYFLIVSDFIGWAKRQGIPVGPGRGSAAGSLVAYAMGITDIDPVRYGLFFERFLNAERVSLPDIDVDFCMNRRDEVLRYVAGRYGGEGHVAQIITFGQMKARAVIRDVGRAIGMPYQEVDRIAKLVPEVLGITLEKALEMEPRLRELADSDPQVSFLLEVARALEGLPRHPSTHAAGVVISDRPMTEYLPLTKGQKGETVTQFDMKCVEKVGLIKFDFLGLKTLTVIDTALTLIREHYGKDLDISAIPIADPATYELLTRGDTTGVFQLESSGMKGLIRRMRPTTFTDLVALVALYRPGPLESGMVEQFVKAKHGEMEATYLLPELRPILEETYGVIVYQEQVMKIAQVLAGYSLGEGDILRRAMGKKKSEEMAAQRERFLAGARERGVPEDTATVIFDLMEKFAGYGFNKSHSAAYALISYQTAWLKTHYPIAFFASLLTNELGTTDGVVKFVNECREAGITVLPPDINLSRVDFTIEGEAIRFGLAAVKNVGASAIEVIMAERNSAGPFRSFEDFCVRVDGRKVNKRVIESLIKCGAFDSLGHRRAALMEVIDQALDLGQSRRRSASSGQPSLFGDETPDAKTPLLPIPDVPEWPAHDLLSREKEVLGFYLSGHPLDPYRADLSRMGFSSTTSDHPDGAVVGLAGLIRSLKVITTKKGDRMAYFTLEDLEGAIEVVCFPAKFTLYRDLLEEDVPLWVEGVFRKAEEEGGANKIHAERIEALETACRRKAKGVRIDLREDRVGPWALGPLKEILRRHPGDYPVSLAIHVKDAGRVLLSLPGDCRAAIDPECAKEINDLVGYPAFGVEYDTTIAAPEQKTGKVMEMRRRP